MSDLIERQAAIDAIMSTDETGYIYWKTYYKDLIEALPSAQPLVIHCTDCEDWLKRQSVLRFTVSNLPFAQPKINNQINLCDSCRYTYPDCPAGKDDVLYGNGKGGDNICACGKYEVERRNTGHWVDAGSGMSMWPWKCSVCGGRQSVISDFCPDCGSKMKSKQFNFCDSCKHSEKSWDEPPCDGCCRGHSAYKPKEPTK